MYPQDTESKMIAAHNLPSNIKLINQIESEQAPYFGLNQKHHQHEDPYGGHSSQRKSLAKFVDNDNFKVAKMLSYDLSSEFKSETPWQEGFIESCHIGEADMVKFYEPGQEREEEKKSSKNDSPDEGNSHSNSDSDDSNSSCDQSSEEDMSGSKSKTK